MVFTGWRQLPALSGAKHAACSTRRGILVWDKRVGAPMPSRFRPQCEYILFGSKGRLDAPSGTWTPGMYPHGLDHARKLHPAGKPVPLLEDLRAVTRPDATVPDPYMGAASGGEACVAKGRAYMGTELSPEYFGISPERLTKLLPERDDATNTTPFGHIAGAICWSSCAILFAKQCQRMRRVIFSNWVSLYMRTKWGQIGIS